MLSHRQIAEGVAKLYGERLGPAAESSLANRIENLLSNENTEAMLRALRAIPKRLPHHSHVDPEEGCDVCEIGVLLVELSREAEKVLKDA